MGRTTHDSSSHISGSDVSGTVVDIGENVLDIKKGDRIVGHPNLTCRICSECTAGKEYNCRQRQVWGFQTGPLWGGFTQYTYLPEVNIIKIHIIFLFKMQQLFLWQV